ncbi:MAG: SAM-dependent methyltransferase, partial [Spirochaetaceae bacterium]|nr:SAM-dependent methyltransferase [Spirochaetaceae bacterium]
MSSFDNLVLGAVYTPREWAWFAIEKFNLFAAWISGKTVFDPTMGEGGLLAALVEYGLARGYALSELPCEKLFGVELNAESHEKALRCFETHYGIDMRGNFLNADIFGFGDKTFDVLLGNPPWCNFTNLPKDYKEYCKPLFYDYELVDNAKKLLLGGSRVDIAALVLQKTIIDNLRQGGEAVFFLPLSLFLNDGAHSGFRQFRAKNSHYALCSVYDFKNTSAFDKIATRCGLARFRKDSGRSTAIPFFRHEDNAWKEYKAVSPETGKPYLVVDDAKKATDIPRVKVPAGAKPRQGVNPCGAAGVFFFNEYQSIDEKLCKV